MKKAFTLIELLDRDRVGGKYKCLQSGAEESDASETRASEAIFGA